MNCWKDWLNPLFPMFQIFMAIYLSIYLRVGIHELLEGLVESLVSNITNIHGEHNEVEVSLNVAHDLLLQVSLER